MNFAAGDAAEFPENKAFRHTCGGGSGGGEEKNIKKGVDKEAPA